MAQQQNSLPPDPSKDNRSGQQLDLSSEQFSPPLERYSSLSEKLFNTEIGMRGGSIYKSESQLPQEMAKAEDLLDLG